MQSLGNRGHKLQGWQDGGAGPLPGPLPRGEGAARGRPGNSAGGVLQPECPFVAGVKDRGMSKKNRLMNPLMKPR